MEVSIVLKVKHLKFIITLLIILTLLAVQVSASNDPKAIESKAVESEIIKTASNSLVNLGIMFGDENGNLNLKNDVKRCEFLALVIRMMGFKPNDSTDGIEIPFNDISKKHWAYESMKIAIEHELISGYTDNTVRPDANVNLVEAQAILLRALNYEKSLVGEWPENVLNKASELSLNKDVGLSTYKELTRGESSVLIYNSLTIAFG